MNYSGYLACVNLEDISDTLLYLPKYTEINREEFDSIHLGDTIYLAYYKTVGSYKTMSIHNLDTAKKKFDIYNRHNK